MSATSRDVARLAAVSQATVSRVLAGHPGVQTETRDRVLSAIRNLGYRPNAAARAMRTSRTGSIGVVTARLANPLYPEMLQVLSRELTRAGRHMVVWDTDDDRGGSAAVDAVRAGSIDGVIFTTATAETAQLYGALTAEVPVALMNRVVPHWGCDQVESDNGAGGRAVGAYFAQADRRRIGLITGPLAPSTIRNREDGFLSALAEHGHGIASGWLVRVGHFSHSTGFGAATRLLELASPPDAIFCVNDVLALGARDAARVRGIPVPEALWLVGYDDIEMASWPAFDLTTVRQPLTEMAASAVRLLLGRIDGDSAGRERVLLPNALVVRGSTARQAHEAPSD
ncbi:LacI family DNA-binding transcriptional regulator [Roseomonas gilardii]|uniref:LacI family DNA-binding transcriptional regulator n=1 Tax=Roseomonas gilardii TaxID=257708 RepID=UPI0011A7BE28|nr:LacI family DNA-binding transcriptional regulator [Roseomonas gilardii]